MKGVILHGGVGSRLRPLTHTGPKQLIPIANKPVSQYVLEDLRAAGITEIAIVLGDVHPEKVRECYGDGADWGVRIVYVEQGQPRGITHAIRLCRSFVQADPFVVYFGDNLLKGGIRDLVQQFRNSELAALLVLARVDEPRKYGIAEFDAAGRLLRLHEKPPMPPTNVALTGILFLTSAFFRITDDLPPSPRGEYEITDALQRMIDQGLPIGYRIVEHWWKDTGSPEDMLDSNRLVLDEVVPEVEGHVDPQASVEGVLVLGCGSSIGAGVRVHGPVVIGSDTLITDEARIGPYVSIGHHVRVRQATISNSIVLDNTRIETREHIADSLIGGGTTVTPASPASPRRLRLVVGEYSNLTL